MRTQLTFQNGFCFSAKASECEFKLDAKVADKPMQGPSPKELLLAGIAGCSGMDVVAHLNKRKLSFEGFEIDTLAEQTTTLPKIFESVEVIYHLTTRASTQAENEHFIAEAIQGVQLSLTKYCGVSAMVYQAVPIFYTLRVNGEMVTRGQADFKKSEK